MSEEEIKDQAVPEHSGPDGSGFIGAINLNVAVETFQKEFKRRSFLGRNAHLGKMIKCPFCDQRHREGQCHRKAQTFANKPGTPAGETNPMVVDAPGRRVANPYWRTHPGTMHYIPELKKFVRIVS
jgi:hypothetical protein